MRNEPKHDAAVRARNESPTMPLEATARTLRLIDRLRTVLSRCPDDAWTWSCQSGFSREMRMGVWENVPDGRETFTIKINGGASMDEFIQKAMEAPDNA